MGWRRFGRRLLVGLGLRCCLPLDSILGGSGLLFGLRFGGRFPLRSDLGGSGFLFGFRIGGRFPLGSGLGCNSLLFGLRFGGRFPLRSDFGGSGFLFGFRPLHSCLLLRRLSWSSLLPLSCQGAIPQRRLTVTGYAAFALSIDFTEPFCRKAGTRPHRPLIQLDRLHKFSLLLQL